MPPRCCLVSWHNISPRVTSFVAFFFFLRASPALPCTFFAELPVSAHLWLGDGACSTMQINQILHSGKCTSDFIMELRKYDRNGIAQVDPIGADTSSLCTHPGAARCGHCVR